MIHSPFVRVIAAILIMLAVLIFLFRGTFSYVQPTPTVHSTLPPSQQKTP